MALCLHVDLKQFLFSCSAAALPERWLSSVSLDLMRACTVHVFVLAATLHAYAQPEQLPSARILQVIRNAHDVYVFPYTTSEHETVDRKHLRLLDPAARDILKGLLGHPSDWFEGALNVVEPLGVKSVGVLFRNGSDELVLFLDDSITISGIFRGRSYYGGLTNKRIVQLEKWKKNYARLER